MKNLFLLLSLFISQQTFAQKTTLSFGLNGGAASFRGSGVNETSEIWTGGIFCGNCLPVAASSFGSKSGFSFGASTVLRREFRNHTLLGLEAGWESLRTKVIVNTYVQDDIVSNVDGKNISNHHFVNLFPHLGYDFRLGGETSLTVAGGADFGLGLKSFDKATIPDQYDGERKNTDHAPGLDFRPRLQLQLNHGKIGVAASYSYGLTNYKGHWDGGNSTAYIKAFRLGLQYRIF